MKTILFSDGTKKEMTFEEVRLRFMPMILQAIRRTNSKFVYNEVEEEDFRQELEIELWRAYEQYELTSGNCFSTYLHYKLQKGIRNVTYTRYSLKNRHNGLISMNAPTGEDDLKLEDMFASDEDTLGDIVYQELVKLVMSNVTEEEQDTLKCMLNKKEFSVQNYADKYGITRQAANQRIVKLRKKLSAIVKKEYLNI